MLPVQLDSSFDRACGKTNEGRGLRPRWHGNDEARPAQKTRSGSRPTRQMHGHGLTPPGTAIMSATPPGESGRLVEAENIRPASLVEDFRVSSYRDLCETRIDRQ